MSDRAFPSIYPVPSGRPVNGRLRVPASKSLTQRYFNLALLGRFPLTVRRPLLSEDTHLFLGALEATGFQTEQVDGDVHLTPGPAPTEPREIFCGNGGTLFRFATSSLAAVPGHYRLDGVPRLRERTVGPLIAALRQLGAEVSCPENDGFAPLEIHGPTLGGGTTRLDASISSQYLSSLIMAALNAPEPVRVEVEALTSEPYVDLTLDAIAELGGKIERDGDVFQVTPWSPTGIERPAEVVVEADFSSVAYPAAAAALAGRARIDDVRESSRQGDRGFLDLLARMGAIVCWTGSSVEVERPADGTLVAIEEDLSATPDQVPTLAAIAPFARGTTRILNVPHLRHKECDRLAAMARELGRLGVPVEELDDGLVIEGVWAEDTPPTEPTEVDTWGDHRIAMCLALVGLRRPGVVIREPGVVVKSYPDYWQDFESLLG